MESIFQFKTVRAPVCILLRPIFNVHEMDFYHSRGSERYRQPMSAWFKNVPDLINKISGNGGAKNQTKKYIQS